MKSRRLDPSRTTPDMYRLLERIPPKKTELVWLSFDVYTLLERCKSRFPELADRHVDIWFGPQETLACIQHDDMHQRILIHSVLNHPDVPQEVIEFIIIHELIHLVVPGRVIEGKLKQHPPEFWKKEQEMAENRQISWSWTFIALSQLYRKDEEGEGLIIPRSWKRMAPKRYPSLENIKQLDPDFDKMLNEAEGLI